MATRLSAQTGDWASAGTWVGGIPGVGDVADIQAGHVVTVSTAVTVGTSGISSVEAIIIRSTGTLNISGTGTLTYRGQISKYSSGTCQAITVSAGGQLVADHSLAADPANTHYAIKLGMADNTYAKLVFNGTVGNRCSWSSVAGGGTTYSQPGYVENVRYGAVQATYTNFTRIDNGSGVAMEWYQYAAEGTSGFWCDHCEFDACGEVLGNAGGAYGDIVYRFLDCNWKNSTGTLNINSGFGGVPLTTGVRLLDSCSFDKPLHIAPCVDITITRCHITQTVDASAGQWAEFSDNVIEKSAAAGIIPAGNITNCYFYSGEVDNPHYIEATSVAANLVFSGNIFEYYYSGVSSDSGECVSGGGYNGTWSIINNISLPSATEPYSPGSLFGLGGDVGIYPITCEHNTIYHQGSHVGETYAGHAGIVASYKSNLTWSNTTGIAVLKDLSGTVNDIVAAGNCDYNGYWNITAGTRYNGLQFSSGTPGVNDISADPQFVDSSRNLATYDIAGLGNSAESVWHDSTAYVVGDVVSASTAAYYDGVLINYRCTVAHASDVESPTLGKPGSASSWRTSWEFQSAYRLREDTTRIALMIEWIKNGFAPRNDTYTDAGHDGVTTGAVESMVVSSSTEILSASSLTSSSTSSEVISLSSSTSTSTVEISASSSSSTSSSSTSTEVISMSSSTSTLSLSTTSLSSSSVSSSTSSSTSSTSSTSTSSTTSTASSSTSTAEMSTSTQSRSSSTSSTSTVWMSTSSTSSSVSSSTSSSTSSSSSISSSSFSSSSSTSSLSESTSTNTVSTSSTLSTTTQSSLTTTSLSTTSSSWSISESSTSSSSTSGTDDAIGTRTLNATVRFTGTATIKNILEDRTQVTAKQDNSFANTTIKNGIGDNQATRAWQVKNDSITSGSTKDLDLYDLAAEDIGGGLGRDGLGQLIKQTQIVMLMIKHVSGAGSLEVFPTYPSNYATWIPPLTVANGNALRAGGAITLYQPKYYAFPIRDASSHTLRLGANSGAVTYSLYVLARHHGIGT